jgi:DEAD/DEAH box helicase domain-containing protein
MSNRASGIPFAGVAAAPGDAVLAALDDLRRTPLSRSCVTDVRAVPARIAGIDPVPPGVHEAIPRYLAALGIDGLYRHQAQSLRLGMDGQDLILATATASGKTLSFGLPVLDALARDRDATALFLYPLKALTHDQLEVLRVMDLASGVDLFPAVYDGDTQRVRRPRVRQESRIVLSNPYEMHETLPYHNMWRRFWSHLRYVVIDEAHRYTGVFGSNVAQLMRRLLRVAQAYGSHPTLILASASIANPGQHAELLTSRPCAVVDDDGSPAGTRHVVFWDGATDGAPSPYVQACDLLVKLVRRGLKTLCFTQSRKGAELVASMALDRRGGMDLKLAPYRAGYLPDQRRSVEKAFREGDILGLVSTNALELGIDVGDLDAVIVAGYPGSVSAFWQQVGRGGRRGGESLAVFLAFEGILDQYVLRTPEVLLARRYECATIDLKNEHILAGHMLCASTEFPVVVDEGAQPEGRVARGLAGAGLIRKTEAGYVYAGPTRPQSAVKLDRIGDTNVALVDVATNDLLETLDLDRALREAFPGAVYLHGAKTWLVESLDLVVGIARLRRQDVDWWTVGVTDKNVEIMDTYGSRVAGTARASTGRIRMTYRVTKFLRKRYDQIIGVGSLDLPERTFSTTGMWLDIAEGLRPGVEDLLGAMHALEHALVGLAPLAISCDPADVAGFSTLAAPHSGGPALFLYDGYEGGIGLAERAAEDLEHFVAMARDVLVRCPCESGCPSCCLSARCGNNNQPMDKHGAVILAREVSG